MSCCKEWTNYQMIFKLLVGGNLSYESSEPPKWNWIEDTKC